MGNAYRKNWKNLQGGPDIIGHDVWDLSATVTQAPSVATSLTDRLGASTYLAGGDARLEGVLVQATGTLGLGRIGVEVTLAGAVVASGALYAGGPPSEYFALEKGQLLDIPVASGQALAANYVVEQVLDAGQVLNVKLNLTLLEG